MSAFTRTLVLSTAAIIFVVCIAAMLLARLFVRPIRRLEAGAQQISSGDYGVTLPVQSRDEFGDLTVAFNDMSRNLAIKEDLLNEQRRENDRLLLSLMPEPVVQRYRDGEETIAQDHQDVTVIFADIVGLDELSAELTSDESLAIVNRLVRQFDAAAENLGVERVRTLHNGYLASCGLNVPRLDNVRRTVDFAIEMQRIIDRFNGETGNELQLRAGIDTGTVTSGLVGRSTLAYDMWGAAVDLAYQVQSGSPQPGVYVTSDVYDAMRDSRQFTAAGEVAVDGEAATHLAARGAAVVTSVVDAPWFYWAVGVAIGLPIGLVLLTELRNALPRRGSALARPVGLVRNYILPLGALLLLLVKATQVSGEATPVRIVATVFGFVVLVLLLSGLNATLFQGAPEGTWRKRIPSIFLDVARFAVIAVGLATDLLLHLGRQRRRPVHRAGHHVDRARPGAAELGRPDHLRSAGAVRAAVPARRLGRHAVGARPRRRGQLARHAHRHRQRTADHPNSVLAAASFTNLSRPPGEHSITVITEFAPNDPPDDVCAMLTRVAGTLPHLRARRGAVDRADRRPRQYKTSIPLRSPADDVAPGRRFCAGSGTPRGAPDSTSTRPTTTSRLAERLEKSMQIIAPTLRLSDSRPAGAAPPRPLTRYGADEAIQFPGQVPKRMTFIVNGRVRLIATGEDGAMVPVRTLEEGDFLGSTTLTREPVTAGAYALDEVTVLQIERGYIEELVARKPVLLQEIGRAIEERRADVRRALAAATD